MASHQGDSSNSYPDKFWLPPWVVSCQGNSLSSYPDKLSYFSSGRSVGKLPGQVIWHASSAVSSGTLVGHWPRQVVLTSPESGVSCGTHQAVLHTSSLASPRVVSHWETDQTTTWTSCLGSLWWACSQVWLGRLTKQLPWQVVTLPLYTWVAEKGVSSVRLTGQLPGQVVQLPLYAHVAKSGVSLMRLVRQLNGQVVWLPPRVVSCQEDSWSSYPDKLSDPLNISSGRLIRQFPGHIVPAYVIMPLQNEVTSRIWCKFTRVKKNKTKKEYKDEPHTYSP